MDELEKLFDELSEDFGGEGYLHYHTSGALQVYWSGSFAGSRFSLNVEQRGLASEILPEVCAEMRQQAEAKKEQCLEWQQQREAEKWVPDTKEVASMRTFLDFLDSLRGEDDSNIDR